jgi:hypothetical protein
VQAVVSARIDHLEEVAKQVLETAAVIGRFGRHVNFEARRGLA